MTLRIKKGDRVRIKLNPSRVGWDEGVMENTIGKIGVVYIVRIRFNSDLYLGIRFPDYPEIHCGGTDNCWWYHEEDLVVLTGKGKPSKRQLTKPKPPKSKPIKRSSKWTIGIEFTYLHTRVLKGAGELVYIFRKEMKANGIRIYNVDSDEGALEISSPKFTNRKEIKKYFKDIEEIRKQYPLAAHTEQEYGGGGHIHYGVNSDDRVFIANVFIDIMNRPYIPYFFNEVGDDISCRLFFDYDERRELWHSVLDRCIGKGYVLRKTNIDTIEFRFFDAYDSEEQLMDAVDFVLAYMSWIKKKKKPLKLKIKSKEDMKGLDCKKDFDSLIRMIGLSVERYKKYHNRYDEWCKSETNMYNYDGTIPEPTGIEKKEREERKEDFSFGLCWT
jgi:hypothetical protein